MPSAYLYANAALYLVFAAWCSVSAAKTATHLGYLSLSRGGESEYLVIYGGLQLGLAIMFAWCARAPEYRTVGLVLALCLYAPIVAYRWATIAFKWPVATLTLCVGTLESILLAVAVWLWFAATR